MQLHELFSIFIKKLNDSCIDYVVTGSVASVAYGEPRLTHDIDLVLNISEQDIYKICQAFPIEEFYCPPEETLLLESKRWSRGHFNIIDHATGFKADIYLAGKEDFLHWALKNKKIIEFLGLKLHIAPIEYVIVKKLEYYREGKQQKHLIDVNNMLEISKIIIDFQLLKSFVSQFHLETEYQDAIQVK